MDISFNAFGGSIACAEEWKGMFQLNSKLIHLDLRHDGLKMEDVRIMGEGLKDNHSLLGIHMIGNEAEIDSLGFANPKKS